MASRNRADAQLLSHVNTTLSTTAAAIAMPARTNFVLVNNPSATIAILVSFDNGSHFVTLAAGASLSVDGDNLEQNNILKIKSASGTPTSECLFGSERL